jgi:LCP family protein required for cell wall assembly
MEKPHNMSSGSVTNKSNMKNFLKYFIITFCVGLVVITPISFIMGSVSKIQIFGETETNLMDEMPLLIDKESRFFEAFQDKNRINVLLLGINDNLADTIMVASFDYDAKHVDLISIPRDTYYYREKYDNPAAFKINAIYKHTKKPLETAIVVSEILLGMPLHCYAIVDYKGIEKIVDTMGGVPMDIPFNMKYSDITDKPPLYIDIDKGYQVLDGEHAVQFLRYRKGYTEGDIGRIKAQQEFMKSAFKQMLGFDLPKISKVIFQNVDSDITLSTAMKISAKAVGMNSEDIETYIMPHTLQEEAPYYVYPDSEGIAELITDIYSIESEIDAGGAVEDE